MNTPKVADVKAACARFSLTEPVELGDMEYIAKHVRAVFPGMKVEVYRNRADMPVFVAVNQTLIHLTPSR